MVKKFEIHLEYPSGGQVWDGADHSGVEVGVKFEGEELLWYDADDGFIPHRLELERGNASIFDHVEDALEQAYEYVHERLKNDGWSFSRAKRFNMEKFPGT